MIECGCCGKPFGKWPDYHRCDRDSVERATKEVEAAMPAFILVIGRRPWLGDVVEQIKAERRAS